MVTPEQVDRHIAIVKAIHEVLEPGWYAAILASGCGLFTLWRTLPRIRGKDGSPCKVLPARRLLA